MHNTLCKENKTQTKFIVTMATSHIQKMFKITKDKFCEST